MDQFVTKCSILVRLRNTIFIIKTNWWQKNNNKTKRAFYLWKLRLTLFIFHSKSRENLWSKLCKALKWRWALKHMCFVNHRLQSIMQASTLVCWLSASFPQHCWKSQNRKQFGMKWFVNLIFNWIIDNFCLYFFSYIFKHSKM